MSVIEAMLTGLPVVATDVRGPREQVVPGVTGLLVPPGDRAAGRGAAAAGGRRGAARAHGRGRPRSARWSATTRRKVVGAHAGPAGAVGLSRRPSNGPRDDRHRSHPPRADLGLRQVRPGAVRPGAGGAGAWKSCPPAARPRRLREAGVPVKEVSEHTGFPEILDGRVKTLVPQIHGGILGRRDMPEHVAQMAAHGIAPIDLVAVNLYPFEATVAPRRRRRRVRREHRHRRPGADPRRGEEPRFRHRADRPGAVRRRCWTNWPSMAAPRLRLRRRLAGEAYARTAAYDAAIAAWFAERRGEDFPQPHDRSPARCGRPCATARTRIRRRPSTSPAAAPASRPRVQVQGKELSYNNLNDTDAAFECVAEFDAPTVAIIKHANPVRRRQGGDAGRGVGPGVPLRSGLAVRRHRRGEPHARRGGGGEDRRDPHRGDHRARRDDGGEGRMLARKKKPAPAADRRSARSVRAGG